MSRRHAGSQCSMFCAKSVLANSNGSVFFVNITNFLRHLVKLWTRLVGACSWLYFFSYNSFSVITRPSTIMFLQHNFKHKAYFKQILVEAALSRCKWNAYVVQKLFGKDCCYKQQPAKKKKQKCHCSHLLFLPVLLFVYKLAVCLYLSSRIIWRVQFVPKPWMQPIKRADTVKPHWDMVQ